MSLVFKTKKKLRKGTFHKARKNYYHIIIKLWSHHFVDFFETVQSIFLASVFDLLFCGGVLFFVCLVIGGRGKQGRKTI